MFEQAPRSAIDLAQSGSSWSTWFKRSNERPIAYRTSRTCHAFVQRLRQSQPNGKFPQQRKSRLRGDQIPCIFKLLATNRLVRSYSNKLSAFAWGIRGGRSPERIPHGRWRRNVTQLPLFSIAPQLPLNHSGQDTVDRERQPDCRPDIDEPVRFNHFLDASKTRCRALLLHKKH
jgi:hypothetical protein